MKYETPELTALTPAINAIQISSADKSNPLGPLDGSSQNDVVTGYMDWE